MQEVSLNLNLKGLEDFCERLSLNLKVGDIVCLFGELGSGKTTFSRCLINSIYKKQNKRPPKLIQSPSFPILLTYELDNFEIYHYDFYRIVNNSELDELNIFEEIKNSITLIEWPEIILNKLKNYNFYSLNFSITNENIRNIKHNLILDK